MKNIFILILFFTIKSYAQEYPLGTDPSDIPANSYIKDTNNDYNKYIGLWKGTWDGKTVFLEFKKIKHLNQGSTNLYYKDEIFGGRKIIAPNGTVEIDRITNFDYPNSEIWGMGIPTSLNGVNYPSFMFFPKNMCDLNARLVVTNISPTHMTLHLAALSRDTPGTCIHDSYVQQYGEYTINFPKDITLIKQ